MSWLWTISKFFCLWRRSSWRGHASYYPHSPSVQEEVLTWCSLNEFTGRAKALPPLTGSCIKDVANDQFRTEECTQPHFRLCEQVHESGQRTVSGEYGELYSDFWVSAQMGKVAHPMPHCRSKAQIELLTPSLGFFTFHHGCRGDRHLSVQWVIAGGQSTWEKAEHERWNPCLSGEGRTEENGKSTARA